MGGKAQHPSSSESDYWGDESWTVDCPCGVSFDDGEEMVECDECGVWVHTACCRVPKGLSTFVCDKCKSKKKKEFEEAPEIPHPSPQRASPQAGADAMHPPDLLRKPANEIPILDRVHTQGQPGGEPHFFEDVSKVFSQQLWKFTGYVPKSFHTKCNDVPSWPSQDDAPERLLALLSSRKEVSLETREDGKTVERGKEDDVGKGKKGTMISLHVERHAKHSKDSKKVEGKSKSGHKSSRSNRDGKVQLHLKRGSDDQNRKESFNKRMRTGNSVKIEEDLSKEDDFSPSGGENSIRENSPVYPIRNPKSMKKMAVQEFMNSHVSALASRFLNSEQIQVNVA